MRAGLFLRVSALILLVLSACTAQPEAESISLDGTRWQLTKLAGEPVLEGSTVTLQFNDGKLGGSAGCNGYGGVYSLDGLQLRAEDVAITAMYCEPDEIMAQEQSYMKVLWDLMDENGARIAMGEQMLVLYTRLGIPALEFIRQETFLMNPQDFIDTAWQLTSVNGQPVETSPRRTLAFASPTELVGFAGCRPYYATYQAEGDTIRVSQMMMLGADCASSEQLTVQEGEFTTLIERAEQFYLQEGRLDIRTTQGNSLTFIPALEAAELEGTTWWLAGFADSTPAMDGMPSLPSEPLPGSEVNLQLVDGRAAGLAGCNRFFAAYTTSGTGMTFDSPGATKMFCGSPDGLMRQESNFLNLLPQVQAYQVFDQLLWLRTGGAQSLIFVAQ